jgi:hypothetical protein
MAIKKMTVKATIAAVRALGMCCSHNAGAKEFRVSHPRVRGTNPADIEATAYYTNDGEDAVSTARTMSQPRPDASPAPRAGGPLDNEAEMAVCALVEPDGAKYTRYAAVLIAMADQLNGWRLLDDPKLQAFHDDLFKRLRDATVVAEALDAGIAAANGCEGDGGWWA